MMLDLLKKFKTNPRRGYFMKTTGIKIFTFATVLALVASTSFAQKNRDRDERYENRDRDDDGRDNRNERNGRYERDRYDRDNDYGRHHHDRRNGRFADRDDDRRIEDYRRGRYHFKNNPYDCRNFPNRWERMNNRDFDWYYFDFNNRFDPRNNFGNRFDPYFPWDPDNRWDIRNRSEYYGNNYYWNGPRPSRIIIVPPSFYLRFGYNNRGRDGHRR